MHQPSPVAAARLACGFVLLALVAGCDFFKAAEVRRGMADTAAWALERAERLEQSGGTDGSGSAEPPDGYIRMTAKAQLGAQHGNALLLVDESEKLVLPILVGETEALSIGLRIAGKSYQRPLTHDLLDQLLKRMGASFVRAQVDELRTRPDGGGTFIGTVVVRDREGTIHEVDARPSDAIALAVGNHRPIFVAQKVIDVAGRRIDDSDGEPGAGQSPDSLPSAPDLPL